MNNTNKIKKHLSEKQNYKLIRGDYAILDSFTGEIISPEIKIIKYKKSVLNNRSFMKKFTNREINLKIKKDLSLLEKEILFDCLDYIDEKNIINFDALSLDFGYKASKISKGKKGLINKGIIKKVQKVFFLNPIIGIKTKEISNELIDLFKNEIESYGIEIK